MSYKTLAILATLLTRTVLAGIDNWLSPEYKFIFQFPLPVPSIAQPITSYKNPSTGATIDYFEIDIVPFDKQTYPDLGTTSYVGYNGTAPGPTFHMTRGREAVVRFINKYDRPSSIHLHGSYSRTPFDGWAEDRTFPGEYKDYYYPNAQPMRTLWYHDHSLSITAVNAYFGQAGFYILDDPAIDAQLKLPSGDYDIPLMLAAKQFLPSGQLVSPATTHVSLWGDVITVNAQPWPYLNVEPRKYKFRLLDASVSRSFSLFLVADSDPNTRLDFIVVGADAGYLSSSVPTKSLVIAMAERYEIVIDFAKYQGQNLTLMNERKFQNNPDYPATDRVLRFVVGTHVSSTDGNGDVPNQLVTLNNPENHPVIDKQFTFETKNGQWLINGVGFEDVQNRVLAFPKQGKVQRWELINNSGGWSHPIHIHLIDFQVTKRSGGRAAVEPYEATALKDVVYLGQNEKVEVVANFAPWSGVYMFHCHNLVHEDDDMMAAFNVSQVDLSAFGYPETTSFIDPMTPAFRSKPVSSLPFPQGTAQYFADIPISVLKRFQDLNAYPDSKGVENALKSFYLTATDAAVAPVSTGGSGGGGGGGKTTLSTQTSGTKTSTTR